MHKISVQLPQNSYNIAIASGILPQLGEQMNQLKLGKKVLLVSNPEIFNYYGEIAIKSLQNEGFEVFHHSIPAGEQSKNLESIATLYDIALQHRLERNSTLVALGGGVIGDMTGFGAATWLRGINFVQVPTTLLAMVDAAIGGKTGVNHPQGKNLIGAFYQPKLVLIDPLVLKTLPEREFKAGMAEVIKYGIIWDEKLFLELEKAEKIDSFETINPELLQTIIMRSCQAKAEVVSKDEKESNLRAILNYGHTIGHAIESLTNYDLIVHGEGVGMGMVTAGNIALALKMWTKEEADRQYILIKKAGLPTEIPSHLKADEIINLLNNDKKVKDGKVRFILPTKIGEVVITDQVSREVLVEVLR